MHEHYFWQTSYTLALGNKKKTKLYTYLDELEVFLWHNEVLVLLYEAYATTTG